MVVLSDWLLKSETRWQLKYLFFTPKIGEDEPILTHIFQMGWFNHQAGKYRNHFDVMWAVSCLGGIGAEGQFCSREFVWQQGETVKHQPTYIATRQFVKLIWFILGCPRKLV